MLIAILRVVLLFLIAHTVLRLVRMTGVRGRAPHPPLPPQSRRAAAEIDPRDVIDATYREVEDGPSG